MFAGLAMTSQVARADDEAPLRLRPAVLGQDDADASKLLVHRQGAWHVTAGGRDSFGHSDAGTTFAHIPTSEPNFTFIARVAEAPTGTPNPKYGVALREGLAHNARTITARYDGYEQNRAIQWFFRHGVARTTHDGSKRIYHSGVEKTMNAVAGFWLRIQRRYPTVTLSYSLDGQTWSPIADGYHLALLSQEVQVGLHVTGGAHGKTPVTAVFDNVSFTVDPVENTATESAYRQHRPAIEPWDMYLIQADTPEGPDTHSFFILKPRNLAWADVRALYYSTGSKEIMLQGRRKLEWESGPVKKRRPVGMKEWEGVHPFTNLRQWYQILSAHRVARLGGAGNQRYLDLALQQLAEKFNEPRIANMKIVATGASAAGGATAQTANMFPDRMIAAAPNLIGLAGWDVQDQAVLATPRLYVFGSQDTGGQHMKQAVREDQTIRQRKARWAHAPTWMGYHVWWRSDQIILPYLLRCIDLRLPDRPDYTQPITLRDLPEESGYIGLNDSWQTNNPTAIRWNDATEAQRRGDSSWLPDALTARLWRAYVSQWPRAVIHFPRYDGNEGFAFTRPVGREIHFMAADEPWPLLASGPTGQDVRVHYFAGLRELKVIQRINDNPYNVLLEPLPAGLHAIHLVIETPDGQEISHAQPILFQPREASEPTPKPNGASAHTIQR